MVSESTGSTRSRIQAVALELFTEQGYEKTSLREIAERLGVTKAALYYHFKSKEEIVNSVVEDRLARLDAIIERAHTRPDDAAGRHAIIAEYADEFFQHGPSAMRFFEQNQTAFKHLSGGQQMRERLFAMIGLLSRGTDSPADQLRAALALFSIHSSLFAVRGPELSNEERKRVALEVAHELLDTIDGKPPAGTD
ncbi:TetR/AcrR family transcriptional regulator [Micromonospora sp. NPDC049559]|uniref:TetR/AcrR family transcriptional regulator n=1 Tax=Micromonospora sp. NPDC049559 TaxID=3155923 RepID=UPI00341A0395